MNNKTLDQRVKQAAEKVLHDENYVCAIDILLTLTENKQKKLKENLTHGQFS